MVDDGSSLFLLLVSNRLNEKMQLCEASLEMFKSMLDRALNKLVKLEAHGRGTGIR